MIKKTIKAIEDFSKQNESTYCFIEGNFYNKAFVIDKLEADELVVKHNGSNKNVKIFEIISSDEFSKRISLLCTLDNILKLKVLHKPKENIVYSTISEFKNMYPNYKISKGE